MKKFILILGLIIIILMSFNYRQCNTFQGSKKDSITIKLEEPYFFLSNTPNDSLLIQALEYYKIQEPNIVLAQAKFETGNYKSFQCINSNNLFGLFNSNTNTYMKFKHWTESIQAYKKYIESKRKPNEDYYKFLTRIGYASDSLYINKLKKFVK